MSAIWFFVALAIVGLIWFMLFVRWGQAIAKSKGYPIGVGGGLGCLLGLFGILIMYLLPRRAVAAEPAQATQEPGPGERRCPHCAEIIRTEAKVCKHCGRDI